MFCVTRLGSPGPRALRAFATGLLLCLALHGCEPADPLESIRQQQAGGDYAGSVGPLRELLLERPQDPEANFLYGRALVFTGQPSLASWSLRQAMQDPEWLVPAGLQLARAALFTSDYNEAVDVTTRILEQHPEDVMALLLRAQGRAHWRNDAEAALEDANRVLELEPDRLEAYEPKILALITLDRHPEAREALVQVGLELAATDAPTRGLAWHCSTTAIFAYEAGEPEKARETWRECLERHPADPNVVVNAVQFYDARADWQRAVEVLETASKLAEGASGHAFRVALADRLRRMGRPAEGEALLREATTAQDPHLAAGAWVDLARFRHAQREHGAAADALERAVALAGDVGGPTPQLLFQYADALVVSGQLDRAAAVAEEMTVGAQRHLIRARVAQERGQHARALEQFDEALRVWPDNAFARYYAALAAEKLGDFDRAIEEYRYSIRISVGATDARTRAARLLIAEGQELRAYQLLFLDVDGAPLDPEGELLSMYLMARVANPQQLQTSLIALGARDPARLPLALARGAEGAADRAGPAAALSLLRGAPGIDYADPSAAPALRALVHFAHGAGRPDVATRAVDTALAAHPEAAVFQELQGLHLELGGAASERGRAAYQRALELDAGNARALAGLGRLALSSDPEQALAFFDRAAVADPSEPKHALAAARALLAAGATQRAERRLEALLEEHPLEGAAAAELVSLDLARDVTTTRTLERARRAARLGGGVRDYEQLSRVHERLEQPREAALAAERAQLLRELQGRREEPTPVG
jgi:tetratricopeptide (TPR) repeat protein